MPKFVTLKLDDALKELLHDIHSEEGGVYDGWEVIESFEPSDEGKFHGVGSIFKRLSDNTYWELTGSRAGDYYQGYDYYWEDEITQVERVEKTQVIVTWKGIKANG